MILITLELGFRPALLWIKATTTGTNYTSWWIADAERNKFNPTGGANTLWATTCHRRKERMHHLLVD